MIFFRDGASKVSEQKFEARLVNPREEEAGIAGYKTLKELCQRDETLSGESKREKTSARAVCCVNFVLPCRDTNLLVFRI